VQAPFVIKGTLNAR